jgi:two-component system chemotaxis sensor kinase CheA
MAKDPYKYFRLESRELLAALGQGVLELEKGNRGKDLVGRILRLTHTLKGAARVVKQARIAELAHTIEDAFAPLREEGGEVPQEGINQVLAMLDAIASQIALMEPARAEAIVTTAPRISEELFETVRVEVEEIDGLLDSASEASTQVSGLRQEFAGVARARQLADALVESLGQRRDVEPRAARSVGTNARALGLAEELRGGLTRLERNFATSIDRLEAELTRVRDASNRLRLLPAAGIFGSLERAVRDAAQTLGKEVLFESFGGEHRLDAHVLAALRDALLHVVRNAVAHGIESPPERAAAAKPIQGRIELRVERRGNGMLFICRDDGRGVDVEAVRRAAVRRGLVASSDASSLGLQEAVRIIMKGGVTTTGAVDQVSGRGIGLDVVRETAARLKGEVTVRSEPGKGTSMQISVPVSLSSITALDVDVGGTVVSLPLAAVRRALRVPDSEIVRSSDKNSIVHDGKVIPFLPLAGALRKTPSTERRRRPWSVVVVEAASGVAAIGVDRLLGATNIVVRPLPPSAAVEPMVAGASLDAEGNPQLVFDPEGLVDAAYFKQAPLVEATPWKSPSVLVIDDSLTTRMLEQSILESAGYQVDLATSGEEGLAKAAQKRYGLFLVDVEMEGMDGFEFVARTQADEALRAIPSIMVTSRSAEEDRRRAERAGARAYVLKGEFDQSSLLRMIREYVG